MKYKCNIVVVVVLFSISQVLSVNRVGNSWLAFIIYTPCVLSVPLHTLRQNPLQNPNPNPNCTHKSWKFCKVMEDFATTFFAPTVDAHVQYWNHCREGIRVSWRTIMGDNKSFEKNLLEKAKNLLCYSRYPLGRFLTWKYYDFQCLTLYAIWMSSRRLSAS